MAATRKHSIHTGPGHSDDSASRDPIRPMEQRLGTVATVSSSRASNTTPTFLYSHRGHAFFTKSWWKEISAKDEFWEMFQEMVPAAVKKRRMTVAINVDCSIYKSTNTPRSGLSKFDQLEKARLITRCLDATFDCNLSAGHDSFENDIDMDLFSNPASSAYLRRAKSITRKLDIKAGFHSNIPVLASGLQPTQGASMTQPVTEPSKSATIALTETPSIQEIEQDQSAADQETCSTTVPVTKPRKTTASDNSIGNVTITEGSCSKPHRKNSSANRKTGQTVKAICKATRVGTKQSRPETQKERRSKKAAKSTSSRRVFNERLSMLEENSDAQSLLNIPTVTGAPKLDPIDSTLTPAMTQDTDHTMNATTQALPDMSAVLAWVKLPPGGARQASDEAKKAETPTSHNPHSVGQWHLHDKTDIDAEVQKALASQGRP